MTDVIQQSVGFFDDPNVSNVALLPLQVSVSDPTLPTMEQSSGLLSPDHATSSRLAHFDPDLYDLRDASHLVRFLKVLLGDAGAGQVRKRYTVARLSATLAGSHFYDLDGFYGALFGAQRRTGEQLPMNPMGGLATPDEWDDITVRDARYRERVAALARSLPMAGTVEGLRQAAEALTGVECDVYETWRMLESGTSVIAGRTWDEIESAYDDWDAVEGQTWAEVTGEVTIGRAGVNNPDEVYVRPKRDYDDEQERIEDEMSLQRVLSMLKPAGVLLTVDARGMAAHTVASIAALQADSNFWEVLRKVAARPGLSHTSSPYPTASSRASIGLLTGNTLEPLPKVPFSNAQSHQWTYNSTITSVAALAYRGSAQIGAAAGTLVDKRNWEQVPDASGRVTVEYRPGNGVTDQRALLAAQAAADSVLQAHPYSGPRVMVPTHG